MSATPVNLTYRTVRIGWCLKKDDFEALRNIARINFACWGGILNPLIVIDDEAEARRMIETFRPDLLQSVRDDDVQIKSFIEKFPYLGGSSMSNDVVESRTLTVADIVNPVKMMERAHGFQDPTKRVIIYKWRDDDPLADVLLLTLGQYPSGILDIPYGEYLDFYNYGSVMPAFDPQAILPGGAATSGSPRSLSGAFLKNEQIKGRRQGIYIGDSKSFSDLITFWNLRALGRSVDFFDPNHSSRYEDWKSQWIQSIVAKGPFDEGSIVLYSASQKLLDDNIPHFNEVGLAIQIVRPSFWSAEQHSSFVINTVQVLGNVYERNGTPALAFELREKPGDLSPSERIAVSVKPYFWTKENTFTFDTIFCPEINEFYARENFEVPLYDVRSEPECLSYLVEPSQNHLDLRATRKKEMIEELFRAFGAELQQSQAGLIARQISNQLGGPQGARVFKIEGVRQILENFRSDQWFDKNAALDRIGNRAQGGHPQFEKHERLNVEYNPKRGKRTPADALKFLLKKEVIRPGVSVKCRNCQMDFWTSVDEIREFLKCIYCGSRQKIAETILDLQWQYKKSGLFGHTNNQEGAIPVLVTIQQLHTCLGTLSLNLSFSSNVKVGNLSCESDFIVATTGPRGISQIVLAECKGRMSIMEDDMKNLSLVAKQFPESRFQTFLLFSKLAPFTTEEIALAKKYQSKRQPNIIMWSKEQLEPYHIYEEVKDKFVLERYDHSLQGLANATDRIYLNPVPKDKEGLGAPGKGPTN